MTAVPACPPAAARRARRASSGPAQEPPDTVCGGAADGTGAAAGVLGAGAAALAGALAAEPARGRRAWCTVAPLAAPGAAPVLGAELGTALPEPVLPDPRSRNWPGWWPAGNSPRRAWSPAG